MVICLDLGADLHMAQLMPLPLTVSCFSKIQTGFTIFWYQLTRVVQETGSLNVCGSAVMCNCVVSVAAFLEMNPAMMMLTQRTSIPKG